MRSCKTLFQAGDEVRCQYERICIAIDHFSCRGRSDHSQGSSYHKLSNMRKLLPSKNVTIEDIYQQSGKKGSFLHVTPKYNVTAVHHRNFYDLVVVANPGESRETSKLDPTQLMQLSHRGLLYKVDLASEYIPLDEFLMEKKQLEGLRKLVFFGMFKESRCFNAWRAMARSNRIRRARTSISQSAGFSTDPFVKASLIIGSALHELGQSV